MRGNWETTIEHVLEFEGAWADHPDDPGGPTMYGITLATYSRWLGHAATRQQLREIPGSHVDAIYRDLYWQEVHGSELPSGVDLAVTDWAVLAGPLRARVHLQTALQVAPDGIFGPITRHAWQTAHTGELLADFTMVRADYLDELAHWKTFGRGWSRRTVATYWAARALMKTPRRPEADAA